MATRILHHAFSAGELSPELFGRVDFAKFSEGLALCRNFIPLPHGPVDNRAGFEFINEVKTSANPTRLIPFSYNNQQTFAIELGAGYFRFHTQGGTLVSTTFGCVIYSGGYINMTWINGIATVAPVTGTVQGMLVSGGISYALVMGLVNNTITYAMLNGVPSAVGAFTGDVTGAIINGVVGGTPVVSAPYEVANAYAAADLKDIHYVQSADVLTLVHPNYPPMELKRFSALNWTFTQPTFAPPQNPPTGVVATSVLTGAIIYDYVVTTVNSAGLQESAQSLVATCTNDLSVVGHSNTLNWVAPVTGAPVRYNVYRLDNGVYGYIGTAGGLTFSDTNIVPDVSRTPPLYTTVFGSVNNYPSAVSYFEQRRVFAGTLAEPQNVWFTRSGTEADMSYTIPNRDDNRIAFKIAAREASAIKHLIPAADLIMLTPSCEWRVNSAGGGALTATALSVKPQSYNGANNVTPVVVSNRVLFASARGGHVREMAYNWQANGYIAGDISLLAPHLFDYLSITDMAYVKGPIPILWCVSSNGKLLGMTYVPEQSITAWHQHDTGAGDAFEAVCVVAEGEEDVLYAIVRRTIGGLTKRYVERMHTRNFPTLADAFFVDSGATYTGAPAITVSGLTWLEGRTVSILADGAVQAPQVVALGVITLPQAASKITVGLPIQADIQTLPAVSAVDPAQGLGRPKNINKVVLRVHQSSGLKVGATFAQLTHHLPRVNEVYGAPPALFDGEVDVTIQGNWLQYGQVCVRQDDPLPLDVASITMEVSVGGG